MRYCCRIILIFILTLFSTQAYCARPESQSLSKLILNGAKVSALVINLSSGKVLNKINENQRLTPASITKLILGSKALETWGSDKTFLTQIYARGKITEETLNGDLIFYGSGDPSFTNEKIILLMSQVAKLGIKNITGNLVVNKSYFGDIEEDLERKLAQQKSHNAYNSPLSSAAVNFSALELMVVPNANAGQPATISTQPFAMPYYNIVNHVKTVTTNTSHSIQVERNTENGVDTFTLTGEISANKSPIHFYRAVSQPEEYAGQVLLSYLHFLGIKISGKIDIENKPLQQTDTLIAQQDGYPLNWQLDGLFKMSNNFIADMLTLNLARENIANDNIFNEKMNLQS